MAATPQHIPGSNYDALQARVAALERIVASVGNKTLFSANISEGGLAISSGGDLTMGPGGDINLSAGGHIKDGAGNIIFSADGTTGERLSTPFLQVQMTPMWNGGSIRGVTDGSGDYLITASHVLTETMLWQGFIPQVLHPQIKWIGAVGRASGSTSIPTYRLYIDGQLVDTWSQTTFNDFTTDPIDITGLPQFGSENVQVTVTIQANVTSADLLAFSTYGVIMCGQ